jgi:hypothetical protein
MKCKKLQRIIRYSLFSAQLTKKTKKNAKNQCSQKSTPTQLTLNTNYLQRMHSLFSRRKNLAQKLANLFILSFFAFTPRRSSFLNCCVPLCVGEENVNVGNYSPFLYSCSSSFYFDWDLLALLAVVSF